MKIVKNITIAIVAGIIILAIGRYISSMPTTKVPQVDKNLIGYRMVGGPDILEDYACQGKTETDEYHVTLTDLEVTVTASGGQLTAHYKQPDGSVVSSDYYPNEAIVLRLRADTDPTLYGETLSPCGEKVRVP